MSSLYTVTKTNQKDTFLKALVGAEIICIGSELLLGNIINSNARWLAEELAYLGIPHFRQTVIGDNFIRLSEAVKEASKRSKVLITTGGLGPTIDDITTSTIAKVFNKDLEEQKDLIVDIQRKIGFNKSISLGSIKKQASIPKGAQLIPNRSGIAPGMIWEPIPGFSILTFPGVPSELKEMWSESAIPWLINKKISNEIIHSKTLNFAGINESKLAETFPKLINSKNPTVAPYASLGEVKLRITAKGKSLEEANQLIQPVEKKLLTTMGKKCYGSNNETLASIVLEILRKNNETLALAESCTGGGLSAALTAIPGSSDVFLGGIVAYSNLAKQELLGVSKQIISKNGAVSSEVVEAMAEGVKKRFKATWTIATSGIAGPTGGEKEKPIGLVHFCVSGPNGIKSGHETFGSYRNRKDIQKLSILKALDRLRLILLS